MLPVSVAFMSYIYVLQEIILYFVTHLPKVWQYACYMN